MEKSSRIGCQDRGRNEGYEDERRKQYRRKEGRRDKKAKDVTGQADVRRQEIESQLQALEAMRMAEAEDEERLRRAKTEAGRRTSTSIPSLTESLNYAANSIKEQRPEAQTTSTTSSSSSTPSATEVTKTKEITTEKEVIEEDRDGVTETLKQAFGTDWCELEETMKTRIARVIQDRFKPY